METRKGGLREYDMHRTTVGTNCRPSKSYNKWEIHLDYSKLRILPSIRERGLTDQPDLVSIIVMLEHTTGSIQASANSLTCNSSIHIPPVRTGLSRSLTLESRPYESQRGEGSAMMASPKAVVTAAA